MGSVTGGRPLRPLRAPRALRATAAACLCASVVAGLAACGPPTSTSASEPESSAAPTESDPGQGLPAAADNRSDIEALSGFACGPDADASWSARGTLTNTGPRDASYVLTVVVAGPESTTVQAKRQVVAVPAGASEAVRMGNLPVSADGELSCHAQVVRQ